MPWQRLGLLFEPVAVHPALMSHAANPVPVPLADDVFRVYYNGRDSENRSSVGYVDVDIIRKSVLEVHAVPVCSFGEEGCYFSHGVSIGNWYEVEGFRYLSFMGWHQSPGDHWRGEIGRVRIEENGSLSSPSVEPMLRIDAQDPLSLSYPWVIELDSGGYGMWYGSTESWDAGNGEMMHPIKFATSEDGLTWRKQGVAVAADVETAQAFSRPCVVAASEAGYEMWFSYRGTLSNSYAIGYATSGDAKTWTVHLAGAGIQKSQSGWDSQMVEYPFVFSHLGHQYMLYNGNGYGRSGIGLAIRMKS